MKKKTHRKRFFKPLNAVCPFCQKSKAPDYKNYEELEGYITDRVRLIPASRSGLCTRHQRQLSVAIKRARFLALLPVVERV